MSPTTVFGWQDIAALLAVAAAAAHLGRGFRRRSRGRGAGCHDGGGCRGCPVRAGATAPAGPDLIQIGGVGMGPTAPATRDVVTSRRP